MKIKRLNGEVSEGRKFPKSVFFRINNLSLLWLLILLSACGEQNQISGQINTLIDSDRITIERPTNQKIDNEPVVYKKSESVTCGLRDKYGDLWFGTNSEGLYRFDGTSFTHYSEQDGLCSNFVTCIIQDLEGRLWLGTDKGLCKFDGDTFTHVPIPWDGNENLWGEGLNANKVLSLIQDKQGNIWFGTWGAGAFRYDGQDFTSFLANEGRKQADSVNRNVIQSILEDKEGNIWLGSMTHGGVSRYDGKKIKHFLPKDGLSDDMVRSSFQDRAGNIWFGTLGNRRGGLDRYDGTSFANFNEKDGLENSNVTCIYEDKSGKIWVGSGRGSVSVYDPSASPKPDGKMFSTFTTREGKSLEGILCIVEDTTGNLWFGGGYGQLWCYNGEVLIDFTQKGRK